MEPKHLRSDLVRYVVAALIILPVFFYLLALLGRKTEEVRRYHRDMTYFERELQLGLSSLAEIIVTANRRAIPHMNGWVPPELQGPATASFVVVDHGIAKGLNKRPSLSCAMSWRPEVKNIQLIVKIQEGWTLDETELDEQGIPQPFYEDHTYTGKIDIRRVIEAKTAVTDFDALLIANEKGKLLSATGPQQSLFSALPAALVTDWEKNIGSTGTSDSITSQLLQTSEALKIDIAGKRYSAFLRQITLRPNELLTSSLQCQLQEPAAGDGSDKKSLDNHEPALILHAVGLIENERLTAQALRPFESVYWFFFLFYMTLFFWIVSSRRSAPLGRGIPEHSDATEPASYFERPGKGGSPPKSKTKGTVAVPVWQVAAKVVLTLGFGLSAGLLVAYLYYLANLHLWENQTLRRLADSIDAEASSEVSAIVTKMSEIDLANSTPHYWCQPPMSRCASIDPTKEKMIEFADNQGKKLEPIDVKGRDDLKQGISAKIIQSRVTGGKELIVVRSLEENGITQRYLTATQLLPAFQQQKVPPGFGFTLARITEDPEGSHTTWDFLLDSDQFRQAEHNLLTEVSDPDCLQLAVENGSFCSARLHGRDARLWAKVLASPPLSRPGQSCAGLDCLAREHRLVLVTYAYQDRPGTQLASAVLVGARFIALVLLVLLVLTLAAIQLGRSVLAVWLPGLAPKVGEKRGQLRLLAIAMSAFLGFVVFAKCWNYENLIFSNRLFVPTDKASSEEKDPRKPKPPNPTRVLQAVFPLLAASQPDSMQMVLAQAVPAAYTFLRPRSDRQLKYALAAHRAGPCRPIPWEPDSYCARDLGSYFLSQRGSATLAGLLLVAGMTAVFVVAPASMIGAKNSTYISWGLIATTLAVSIALLIYRQELLASLTLITTSLDNFQRTMGSLADRFSLRPRK